VLLVDLSILAIIDFIIPKLPKYDGSLNLTDNDDSKRLQPMTLLVCHVTKPLYSERKDKEQDSLSSYLHTRAAQYIDFS